MDKSVKCPREECGFKGKTNYILRYNFQQTHPLDILQFPEEDNFRQCKQ